MRTQDEINYIQQSNAYGIVIDNKYRIELVVIKVQASLTYARNFISIL